MGISKSLRRFFADDRDSSDNPRPDIVAPGEAVADTIQMLAHRVVTVPLQNVLADEPKVPGVEEEVFGRTGLKDNILSLLKKQPEGGFKLADGRWVQLEAFPMTLGMMGVPVLGGQYRFVLYVGENDVLPASKYWMYAFNFENATGALALDPSFRPVMVENGDFTSIRKSPREAIAEIEKNIDELADCTLSG